MYFLSAATVLIKEAPKYTHKKLPVIRMNWKKNSLSSTRRLKFDVSMNFLSLRVINVSSLPQHLRTRLSSLRGLNWKSLRNSRGWERRALSNKYIVLSAVFTVWRRILLISLDCRWSWNRIEALSASSHFLLLHWSCSQSQANNNIGCLAKAVKIFMIFSFSFRVH